MRMLATLTTRLPARIARAIAALTLALAPALAVAPTPAAAVGPTVTAITFSGTPDTVIITIDGSGFGSAPVGNTSCVAGGGADGSRTFGTALYIHDFAVPGRNPFDAGRDGVVGAASYCDTIGLFIDSYSDTHIRIRPGSDYLNATWNWRFQEGDPFIFGVAGVETPVRNVTYTGSVYYFTSGVSGTASCAGTTLPGARVDLFSGTSLIATTTADGSGGFSFTIAPATYTLRYTSGPTVCGGPVTVTAGGTASAPAPPALIDLHNHSWPAAYPLTLSGASSALSASTDEHLARQDQSAWFKFTVQPGSRVVVTLTNLPANYTLTLYKDIGAAFASAATPADLSRLSAEFAPDAFSPDAFSPDAFSPDAFSPDAFSAAGFSPDAFSPDAFSPDAFSPDAFSPDAFSPDAFSPDAFSPDAFSPDAFSPDAFSPSEFSPDAFSGGETALQTAFASAQTRSVLGVSAFSGTASQGIVHGTWDSTGDFYVRVRGHNGAFSLAAPFHLSVTELTGACAAVGPVTGSTLGASAAGLKTLVLTNLAATPGTSAEKTTLSASLSTFVHRTEIAGTVVDISGDARIMNAAAQASAHTDCPYAKNVLAGEIKRVVDAYRTVNPSLAYVVLVGGDAAIPFFRHPDEAGLAGERDFSPPVLDASASQASLKDNYVLSQDDYGAAAELSINDHTLPLPGLAVGRLVETAADANGMLGAYLATSGGRVPASSSLVTGYDFLARPASAISAELSAGTGVSPDTLIQPNTSAPTAPNAWNASALKTKLLGTRHDLVFLGGHFSATSALAADFSTRVLSTDLTASSVDLTNALIFSAGCHAGYNIVDGDAVQNVTPSPDWPRAFASKKATLIAGTGYQYGDTDVIEYSTRLYLEFSQALRTGSGPIPVGQALVAAKKTYLAKTAQLRGIHEKAFLETTLYGLPQLAIDEPGARLSPPSDTSIVGAGGAPLVAESAGPGKPAPTGLGLQYADVSLSPSLTRQDVPLSPAPSSGPGSATSFIGPDGQVVNPDEPVLPLKLPNVTGPAGTVLRGVGLRSGSYADLPGIRPLTGAAATELRVPHTPFFSSVLFPVQLWRANYFDAVTGGATHLAVTPAQFVSDGAGSLTGSLRTFSTLGLRLYYSGHTGSSALSAAPAVSRVSASPNPAGTSVAFSLDVAGDPGAGVQEVWVTYTGTTGALYGQWQSVDLTHAAAPYSTANPSTRWTGTLALPSDLGGAANLRFVVQATNGNGVVALATNRGAFYTPAPDAPALNAPKQPTSLALSGPTSALYRDAVTYTAVLTNSTDGSHPANRVVTFGFGGVRHLATTGTDGSATVSLPLLSPPGTYDVRVSFDEAPDLLGTAATSSLTISPQATSLTFDAGSATAVAGGPIPLGALLSDGSAHPRALLEQPVYFVFTGGGLTRSAVSTTSLLAGRAPAPPVVLPAGNYNVTAAFGGVVDLGNGQSLNATDPRYNASRTGSVALTVTADPATVSYIGPTTLRVGGTLALAATVAPGTGSALADLTLANVQFTVLDQTGATVQSATAPVSASGAASAPMSGLAAGVYTLATSVAGGYFNSPPVRTTVAVYDPTFAGAGAGVLSTRTPATVCPPAGSLPYTCSLTAGQAASFAFALAYPTGATLPAGALRLQVGKSLSVSATADPRTPTTPPAFDWLVVTANRVQLQGTGTVNGTPGLRFRADGLILGNGKFSFEMRIWDAHGSYDAPTYALGDVITPQKTDDDPVGGIVIRRITGS